MKVEAIIQARMDSTRLPRKIFMQLNGISLLECLFNQLSYSKLLVRKIIATTTNKEDDTIIDFARSNSIDYFRGSSTDVLDRYYQCAKYFSIQHIVRITSDCPLIDPEVIDKVISIYKNENFDYVNNFYNTEKAFTSGTDVEIFSFNALEKAWKNATKSSEREHVTPYIYKNPDQFSIGHIEFHDNMQNLHWSVDRLQDLEFVRALYNKIQKKPILVEDILKVIKDNPSILEINKDTNPNEGYLKSLKTDEI